MLFHIFSLIDRLFLSCTVGDPHIRGNNCFISNRLRFTNARFCWHYAIVAADKSHLMAVTSSSMTIQFKVSFQKEKMTILLQLYYPYDKYLLFFCSLFVDFILL